jgi:hypothetical protein
MRHKLSFKPALLIAAIAATAGFVGSVPTTVSGNVQPIDGALHAFLYSSTDTISTNVDNTTGRFEFSNVKPASYQLLIEGRPPYRNSVKDGIRVVDGQPNDAGVIVMQK